MQRPRELERPCPLRPYEVICTHARSRTINDNPRAMERTVNSKQVHWTHRTAITHNMLHLIPIGSIKLLK